MIKFLAFLILWGILAYILITLVVFIGFLFMKDPKESPPETPEQQEEEFREFVAQVEREEPPSPESYSGIEWSRTDAPCDSPSPTGTPEVSPGKGDSCSGAALS